MIGKFQYGSQSVERIVESCVYRVNCVYKLFEKRCNAQIICFRRSVNIISLYRLIELRRVAVICFSSFFSALTNATAKRNFASQQYSQFSFFLPGQPLYRNQGTRLRPEVHRKLESVSTLDLKALLDYYHHHYYYIMLVTIILITVLLLCTRSIFVIGN